MCILSLFEPRSTTNAESSLSLKFLCPISRPCIVQWCYFRLLTNLHEIWWKLVLSRKIRPCISIIQANFKTTSGRQALHLAFILFAARTDYCSFFYSLVHGYKLLYTNGYIIAKSRGLHIAIYSNFSSGKWVLPLRQLPASRRLHSSNKWKIYSNGSNYCAFWFYWREKVRFIGSRDIWQSLYV